MKKTILAVCLSLLLIISMTLTSSASTGSVQAHQSIAGYSCTHVFEVYATVATARTAVAYDYGMIISPLKCRVNGAVLVSNGTVAFFDSGVAEFTGLSGFAEAAVGLGTNSTSSYTGGVSQATFLTLQWSELQL